MRQSVSNDFYEATLVCHIEHFFGNFRIVVVEDLGSVNGTFVNGNRLAPHRPEALHTGDQLQLGELLIEVDLS